MPPPRDTMPPPRDTMPPPRDTMPPPRDTMPPPQDTNPPPQDTNPPPQDTNPPPQDTNPPPQDTAPPPADSQPLPDTGVPPYSGSFPTAIGSQRTGQLTINGNPRRAEIYVPSGKTASPALVLAFHGTDQSGSDIMWDVQPAQLAQSNGNDVVVIAPYARRMPFADWDQHGPNQIWFENYPNLDINNNEDLVFVRAIIAEAHLRYNIDLKRVYTMGHSNGAFFSLFVAMRLNNQIAAFAEASGGLVRCSNTSDCHYQSSSTNWSTIYTSGNQSSGCNCSGAEKPGPVVTSGRKPPGYLIHENRDPTVSVHYTAALAQRMQSLGYTMNVIIRNRSDHSWPPDHARLAYSWMRQFRLP
jgi:poly(3-hydroxybutyrate) depolymerase